MNIPNKKLDSGFEMPVFGIGTWGMGGKDDVDFSKDEVEIQAIRAAIDLGVTHIDTAEIYAQGHSEELVAEAIKSYDRSKLFLVSKASRSSLTYDGILRACEGSLERLQTDYLDVYLMHRYPGDTQLRDCTKAMDRLLDEGLIRNTGVSNFTKEHVRDAQNYSDNKIVCNQVHYNLEFREPEATGLLGFSQEHDVFLMAWRPVEKGGLLTQVPKIVKEVCEKYGKTPAQVAINWLVSQNNVITLAKASNVEHLKENLGGVAWEMGVEDIERLRNEFPGQQDVSNTVPLA